MSITSLVGVIYHQKHIQCMQCLVQDPQKAPMAKAQHEISSILILVFERVEKDQISLWSELDGTNQLDVKNKTKQKRLWL